MTSEKTNASRDKAFNLFHLARPSSDYIERFPNQSRIFSRFVGTKKNRDGKAIRDMERIRQKSHRATYRRICAERDRIQRLVEHHLHVEEVLKKVKDNSSRHHEKVESTPSLLERKRVRYESEGEISPTSSLNSILIPQSNGRFARAATQRAVAEMVRRKRKVVIKEKFQRADVLRQQKLDDLSSKCREKVVMARDVAKRVKAARILQRAFRRWFKFKCPEVLLVCSKNSAMLASKSALKLQIWPGWRRAVSFTRYFDENNGDSPCKALKRLFPEFVDMKKDGSYKFVSFETCSATLQDNAVIRDAALFIMALKPLLNIRDECSVQARSFLSAFLIASYPEEVLGGFSENVVSKKLIYKCASRVVHAMSKLFLSQSSQITSASLVHMAEMYQRFFFSFHAWRGADIYKMTNELKLSAIQTWSAFLFETEAVKLIDSMVTKSFSSAQDDPLASLRMRHKAGLIGAQKHLRRLKDALSKVVGKCRTEEIMAETKLQASDNIKATLQEELDCIANNIMSTSPKSAKKMKELISMQLNENNVFDENVGKTYENTCPSLGRDSSENDVSDFSDDMLIILSNESLVHEILLSDPDEMHLITLNGNGRLKDVVLCDFMVDWKYRRDLSSNAFPLAGPNLHGLNQRDYFDQILEDLKKSPPNYSQLFDIIDILFKSINSLEPRLTKLPKSFRESFELTTPILIKNIIDHLIEAALVLIELEAQTRAQSTSDWVEKASDFLSQPCCHNVNEVFGIDLHSFAVASVNFLLFKVYLCQQDILNSRIIFAAPYIKTIGIDFEREKFQKKYGSVLSATREWLSSAMNRSQRESIALNFSYEQKMSFIENAFVDGLLFPKKRIMMPEVFDKDSTRLFRIREVAKISVIGSAIILHVASRVGVGATALSSDQTKNEESGEKNALVCALTEKYISNKELSEKVFEAMLNFATALHPQRGLHDNDIIALKHHLEAILNGDDRVLKLLDLRMRQFFRSVCKGSADPGPEAPRSMTTGTFKLPIRTMRQKTIYEMKRETFIGKARKEATRLGFAFFAKDLALVGMSARNCFRHMWKVHEPQINSIVNNVDGF